MLGAGKGSNIEKRGKKLDQILKGLQVRGFSSDPLSRLLVAAASWRLTEKRALGSLFSGGLSVQTP